MAIFRQVHTSFWNDVKVQEEFTPEDKYFFLYLLTNPQTKQIGVYQIT
ncbi:chromosomal replication initiator DnaA, partial [Bacillus cereus]